MPKSKENSGKKRGILNEKKKPKKGDPDFKKVKNKVGKAKKLPQNETKTDFKATKIIMPNQHALATKGPNVTRRNMNLTDLLGHVKHHNIGVRTSAFGQLKDLLNEADGLVQIHLGRIVDNTWMAALDAIQQVRKEYRSFIQWLLQDVSKELEPFYRIFHLQMRTALTHVDTHIRREGFNLVDFYLTHEPAIVRDAAIPLIEEVLLQQSHASFVDGRRVRLIRKLLTLHLSSDSTGSQQSKRIKSIHDLLSGKERRSNLNLEEISEFAIRAYEEASDGLDGLQVKLNALTLLHRVPDFEVQGQTQNILSFPHESSCPAGINRKYYGALVDSINLHMAHLLARSSSSFKNAIEDFLLHFTSNIRGSDVAIIDEDESISLQTVKSRVEKIIAILELILHSMKDEDKSKLSQIISNCCVPKNDTGVELMNRRVLMMIPFINTVYHLFDEETVLQWINHWPKVLWYSDATQKSILLQNILGIAKFNKYLFQKIQGMIMPLYLGMGPVPAPIKSCSNEDQITAISILYYIENNWTKMSNKIGLLLQSSLCNEAQEILIDLLLQKDSSDETILRILLRLLETMEGIRKVVIFTNNRGIKGWNDLALPLAERARELDNKEGLWCEYLLQCAEGYCLQLSESYQHLGQTENLVHGQVSCQEIKTAHETIFKDIIRLIIFFPPTFPEKRIIQTYYKCTPSWISSSKVYEILCKRSKVLNNYKLLEATILDQQYRETISREDWGRDDPWNLDNEKYSIEVQQELLKNIKALGTMSHSEFKNLMEKDNKWNHALLPML